MPHFCLTLLSYTHLAMNTNPLSRVALQAYTRVSGLYESGNTGLFDISGFIAWGDKYTLIVEFFEQPQYYEYENNFRVDITAKNLF